MAIPPKLPGLRIAQTVPGLTGGGLERMVADLTNELVSRGHVAEVFSVGDLGVYAEQLSAAGIPVHDCRTVAFRIPGVPIRLTRALRRFRADVVHAHSGVWYPTSAAGFVLGTPVVFTDHGRYPPESRLTFLVQRWCARVTAELVAVSASWTDYLRHHLRLSYTPRVVENGIDLSPYSKVDAGRRNALRAEWGFLDRDVVVTMLGRLEPVKNAAGLLDALSAAGRESLCGVFLGTGSLEAELKARVQELGVASRVRFLGFRKDVADCLAASDVLAMPSHSEGLPIALLEAFAAGLPVVASAVGGIPTALGEPPAGILIPPGDSALFEAALSRLHDDPALRRELGERARNRASSYTIERMTDAYEAIYRRVAR